MALFGAFVLGLGFSISLAQAALAGLVAWRAWDLARDPAARREARWPLLAPAVLVAVATVVSALASPYPLEGLKEGREVLLVVALYVTLDVLRDGAAAGRFVTALTALAGAAALLGLAQVAGCPGPGSAPAWPAILFERCTRARGPFSIYMTLAGVLTLVLLVSLPRLLPGAARGSWLPPVWLTGLLGLAATFTRGAWLGFAAGAVTLALLVRRGRGLLLVGLVALTLAALFGPTEVRQRARSMADPAETTIRERLYIYRSGFQMWRDYPLFGAGPGAVRRLYEQYGAPERIERRTSHLHNTPLQILVERGPLALAGWVWLWVAFYGETIARLRRLPAARVRERSVVVGALAAITGFLVAGLSEYNFGDSEVVMVAWAVAALPYVVARPDQ
jgi:O-antigen ligase